MVSSVTNLGLILHTSHLTRTSPLTQTHPFSIDIHEDDLTQEMRLKDAPAACEAKNHEAFVLALKANRVECIRQVEIHEHRTPDLFWRTGDPAGRPPRSEKDKARMKLVATVFYKNDKPVFPPAFTRLSDELVYLATKFLPVATRGKHYPYDFMKNGDIRLERVPSGVSPIVWAHGLPHFPVYKGYYILCGRKHAKWIGWWLNIPNRLTKKNYPVWTIGAVVAPASALGLPRVVERQLRVHKPSATRDVETGSEKYAGAHDVVQKVHYDHSIVPKISSGGYRVIPICQTQGYQIRVGPNWPNGRLADVVHQEMFSANGLEHFDYIEALKKPYVNEKCPQAGKDALYGSDEEADGQEFETREINDEDEEISEAGDYLNYTNAADSDYQYDETLEDDDLTDDSEHDKAVINPLNELSLKDAKKDRMVETMGGHFVTTNKVVKTTNKTTKVAKANMSKAVPQSLKVSKKVAKAKGDSKSTSGPTTSAEITRCRGNLTSLPDNKVIKTEPKQPVQQSITEILDEIRVDAASSGTMKKLTEDEMIKKAACLSELAFDAVKNRNTSTAELDLEGILEKAAAYSTLVKAAARDLQKKKS